MSECKYKIRCPLRILYGCEIADCSEYRQKQIAFELRAEQSRIEGSSLDGIVKKISE